MLLLYFFFFFFFSSRRRHTRSLRDWSSDVCSSDLHRVGELVGIDLPPGDRLRGGGPGQAARVRPGVGDLDVIVVAAVREAEDLLDLRLGLENEVLRRAAAQHQHAALAL